MNGRFITFEGGEGAGKSTMIHRVDEWFRQRGQETLLTREPGGTELAELMRSIVLDYEGEEDLGAQAELLLVFAARSQHLHSLIRPALERGLTVLCDRFTDASWAYQGGGRGLAASDIALLESLVHGDLQPQLTLLLDLPVEAGMARAAERGKADRIEQESLEFFERVRSTYHDRASKDPTRFEIIDASPAIEEVWDQIRRVLETRFD